jgi:hypothetical protein
MSNTLDRGQCSVFAVVINYLPGEYNFKGAFLHGFVVLGAPRRREMLGVFRGNKVKGVGFKHAKPRRILALTNLFVDATVD